VTGSNVTEKSGSRLNYVSLAERPLQILTTCRLRDLPILEITARKLRETVPCRKLYVIAPDRECRYIKKELSNEIQVIPENEFIPGMKIEDLRRFNAPHFPKNAGWYFQQFLKLQFCFVEPEEDYYLVWDADTVPLRPLRFFDAEGKMLLTKATEYHKPYFETYRKLFGEAPQREFSFIAQHMLVQKSVAREMLAQIEQRIEGKDNWAWKIMRSLTTTGGNLFSEYETYGHYIKQHHPERVRFINRSWQRDFVRRTGPAVPSEKQLATLAGEFDFVAFERASRGWRRVARMFFGGLLGK
jgi:hypothetical protein